MEKLFFSINFHSSDVVNDFLDRFRGESSLFVYCTGFTRTPNFNAKFNSRMSAFSGVIRSFTATRRTFHKNSKIAIKNPTPIPKPTSKNTPPTLAKPNSAAPAADAVLSLRHFP